MPGLTVVAVVDPALPADSSDIPVPVRMLSDIRAGDVDYCVVSIPPGANPQVAAHLATEGIPTVFDKPLATSMSDALTISARYTRGATECLTAYTERYQASIEFLRSSYHLGCAGELLGIHAIRAGKFRTNGLDMVHDLLTHDLDLTGWIIDARISQIDSARYTENLIHVTGQLTIGIPFFYQVANRNSYPRRQFRLIGTNQRLSADTLNSRVLVRDHVERSRLGPPRMLSTMNPPALIGVHRDMRDQVLRGMPGRLASINESLARVLDADHVREALLTS
jgi:predicted dehydrogenase